MEVHPRCAEPPPGFHSQTPSPMVVASPPDADEEDPMAAAQAQTTSHHQGQSQAMSCATPWHPPSLQGYVA
eukprot:3819012-Prorocentrum_lima.AAC.1